jgi:hypothetical protein
MKKKGGCFYCFFLMTDVEWVIVAGPPESVACTPQNLKDSSTFRANVLETQFAKQRNGEDSLPPRSISLSLRP